MNGWNLNENIIKMFIYSGVIIEIIWIRKGVSYTIYYNRKKMNNWNLKNIYYKDIVYL